MSDATIRARLLTLVRERNYVSMAEVERMMPEAMDEGSRRTWCALNHENLILWIDVSDEFIEAVTSLLSAGEIELHRTGSFIYFLDGCHLKFPVAKHIRSYAKPHWLPVTLCRPGSPR